MRLAAHYEGTCRCEPEPADLKSLNLGNAIYPPSAHANPDVPNIARQPSQASKRSAIRRQVI